MSRVRKNTGNGEFVLIRVICGQNRSRKSAEKGKEWSEKEEMTGTPVTARIRLIRLVLCIRGEMEPG